jgi:hypothetical protein
MKGVAEMIANVEDTLVEGIVNRIPRHYLPEPCAANIVRNLISRRAQVGAAIS